MTTDNPLSVRSISHCHFCGNPLINKFVEDRNRFFCESCNVPIYQNPVPATCIVVVDASERLLLVKRSVEPKIGQWCLPGGFIELNERPDASALRELKEETGLTATIEDLLGVCTNHSSQYETVLMVGYLVKNFSGKLIAGDDAADAAWFGVKERPEIAFDSHRKFVRQYYNRI